MVGMGQYRRMPWCKWLLVPIWIVYTPIALAFLVIVVAGLGALALLLYPYVMVYPDHFENDDFAGPWPLRWRDGYRRLGFLGRVQRCVKLWRRRRRARAAPNRVTLKIDSRFD